MKPWNSCQVKRTIYLRCCILCSLLHMYFSKHKMLEFKWYIVIHFFSWALWGPTRSQFKLCLVHSFILISKFIYCWPFLASLAHIANDSGSRLGLSRKKSNVAHSGWMCPCLMLRNSMAVGFFIDSKGKEPYG